MSVRFRQNRCWDALVSPPLDQGRLKQRYRRLLKIQELLLASARGMTPKELLEALDKLGHPYAIKERRLYEDLQFLCDEADGQAAVLNDGGRYRAVLGGGQVALTEREAVFCLSLMHSLAEGLLDRSSRKYRDALVKRLATLHPHLAEKVSTARQVVAPIVRTSGEEEVADDALSTKLVAAIDQKRQVNLILREAHLGQVLGCYPLRLLFYVRSWYLIGYCNPPSGLEVPMQRQLRTFRLDNIKQVEVLIAEFVTTAKMDVDAALDRAWGLNFYDPIVSVSLRFSPAVADRIESNRRHPSASVEREADGSLLYVARYHRGSRDFRQWVRQYGLDVEVLKPLELRKEVIQDLQQALERYQT